MTAGGDVHSLKGDWGPRSKLEAKFRTFNPCKITDGCVKYLTAVFS